MKFPEALQGCMYIAKDLLNFPLQGIRCDIFSEDGIRLFRDLSEKMQFNRRKRSWGIFGGSLTSIAGGGLAIAGAALLPFTFGAGIVLIPAGAGVGAVGAVISVGFGLDKYFADRQRESLAKPLLEKFINFQKDLVTAIAVIHTTVSVIQDQKEHNITLDGGVSLEVQQKLSQLKDKLKELRRQSEGFQPHEIIHEISELAGELSTDVLTTVMQPIKASLRVDVPWFEEKIKLANEKPFELLISAIDELDEHHNKVDGTLFGFVKKIFESTAEEPEESLIFPTGVCLDGAGNVVVKAKGGIFAARTAIRAVDVSIDTARIANNVLRAARVVSIAGIVLNAVGIVIDVGFLGLAAYDLTRKDKEDFPRALDDIAVVMENLNKLWL